MPKTKAIKRQNKLEKVIAALAQSKSILVSGHVRPDGDSLGCMIALAHLLNRAGLKAAATADSKNLGSPAFLNGTEKLLTPGEIAKRRFDLIVATDCGSFERLPEPVQAVAAKKVPLINIDHHRTNTYFGSLNWIGTRASSTGEMIWQMARKAGWQLDQTAAEALWVAIITDTGRFAYDQTTPATMRCGADLLRHGVRTAFINDKLYCSFSRTAVELKRRAYRTLSISENSEVASVTLTGKDFEETGGTKADAEDVIEIPRGLVGNRVALFFYGNEEDKGETRVSVRTRPPLDATWLAKRFGGGGHERAAGFSLQEPLPQAKKKVNNIVAEWLASQPGH
ncbi:MAG: bifunctional oligoribonuclease/PAP phosphatase NrnA [Kiritimatiellae bacterium]|nr:bifunctional oligoribonuclease/PAP phosphatase NrnA [Kiritimatiellia bacterium]MDD4623013.1 bifunctional oligoribonuclease/PAP phosphatase NrnA [Kiritimatiellia bacterium]